MFMPDGAQERVQEKVTTFTTSFAKNFGLGLATTGINLAKEEAAEETSDQQLMQIPKPDWILKEGFLTKKGAAANSGFKKRYFVAYNKADKFVIKYFVDKKGADDPKVAPKGQICPVGYHVRTKEAKFAIHLEPRDDEDREWIMNCESKEEQEAWESVFQNACWHAEAAAHEDPLVQGAFECAFSACKAELGINYYMPFDRQPEEMLAKLISADLSREIFPEIWAAINPPMGIGKSMAVRTAKKILVGVVSSLCKAAWAATGPIVEMAKQLWDSTAKPQLSKLFEAEETLKGQIADAVASAAQPAIDQLNETIFGPVTGAVMDPVIDALKAAMAGFKTCTEAKVAEIKDVAVMQDLVSDVSYSYSSGAPMKEVVPIIRALDMGFLAKLAEGVPGVSVWRFTWYLDSAIRDLLRRAIYTTHVKAKEGMEAGAALAAAAEQLAHDCKLIVKEVVFSGIMYMIEDMVNDNVITPCVELAKPIDDLMPELAKQFLNISQLLEDTLNKMLEAVVEPIAAGATESAIAKF